MRRLAFAVVAVLFCLCAPSSSAQLQRAFGFCEVGGQAVTLQGLLGTPDVQASYPGCTITVYVHGTLTLATLYQDSGGTTPLSNPFTASVTTGYWFFYGANGRYDATESGTGLTTFTFSDIVLGSGGGGGGSTPGGADTQFQFNVGNIVFGGSNCLAVNNSASPTQVNIGCNFVPTGSNTINLGSFALPFAAGFMNSVALFSNQFGGTPLPDYYTSGAAIVSFVPVKFDPAGTGNVIPATTSDTAGIIGISTGNVSGTGQLVPIAYIGAVTAQSDGACTANQFVVNSTTTTGDVHCTSSPGSAESLGIVVASIGSAGTVRVQLQIGGGNGGGGGGANPGGAVNSMQYQVDATHFGGALGGIGQLFTGQGPASVPVAASPGVKDGNGVAVVTTTPYTVQCDSGSPLSLIDRGTGLRFQSGAAVVTIPQASATGCANLWVTLYAEVSLTINRSGSDTFTIYTGSGVTTGATTTALSAGQYIKIHNGAPGLWELEKYTGGGGGGITCSNTGAIAYWSGSAGVCDPSTALDGSGNETANSVATVQNYATVGIGNDLTNPPANGGGAKIVVGAIPGISSAVGALTTDPPGTQVYPVASGAGSTGSANLIENGEATNGLTFDGTPTAAGDCVISSVTVSGEFHDTGVTCTHPEALVGPQWVVGTLRSVTPVSGSKYLVDVRPFFVSGGSKFNSVDLPNNSTGIAGTLCASAVGACNNPGEYLIHWNFWGTGTVCSSPAGGVGVIFTWTDRGGTTHTTVQPQMTVQTGPGSTAMNSLMSFQTSLAYESGSGYYVVSTNGSVITYGSTYNPCTTGTGSFGFDATVSRLQ